MLQQKENRVRISSQRDVINVSDNCFLSESRCSCPQCDSISCFQIRKFNSGISCTCPDCNTNRCLTWDNDEEINQSKEIPKNLENVSVFYETDTDSTPISEIEPIKDSCLNEDNTTNGLKNKICSYFSNNIKGSNVENSKDKSRFPREEDYYCDRKLYDIYSNKKNEGFRSIDMENKNPNVTKIKPDSKVFKNTETIPEIKTLNGDDDVKCDAINDDNIFNNSKENLKKSNISIKAVSNTDIFPHIEINKSNHVGFIDDIEDMEKINSDIFGEKTDFKKCCLSNTAVENKNYDFSYPKHEDPEYEDRIISRKTFETKNDDPEISNFISNKKIDIKCDHMNKQNRNSHISKEKQEFKECCSSKVYENKNYDNPVIKQNLTTIEVQEKKKMSSLYNAGPNMCTKSCCSAKKVLDDKNSDNSEVHNFFSNENKNTLKYNRIHKDFEVKETDAEEQSHQKNKTQTLKHPVTRESSHSYADSHTNKKVNNLTRTVNVFDDANSVTNNSLKMKNFERYVCKDVSHTKKKTIRKNNENIYEKSFSHLQSIAISYAEPNYDSSRAELSAQVMNVPYEEFKETLPRRQSSTHSNINYSTTSNQLPKLDIFSRLKEIYKACSCKVCECIPGKSIFKDNEVCNCKPCDCDDCRGYMTSLQERFTSRPHSGCPCVACDRKDCRGVVKDVRLSAICDCEPCNCVKYTESYTKPCNCTPCQCETCLASVPMPQTLLVANMTQHYQQSNCDCDPCECQNCTSSYSAMTSNSMREVSTGMITYGNCSCRTCPNDSCQLTRSECRCDARNKVMTKPLAKNSPDYGIHRVNVKEKIYSKSTVLKNNHNTVAMFALSNTYSNGLFNYSNKKDSCQCEVCECIVCKDKGKVIKDDEIFNKIFNTKSLNSCNCLPCQCESCKRYHNLNTEKFEQRCCVKNRWDIGVSNRKSDGINICNDNYKVNKKSKPTYSTVNVNSLRQSRECDDCLVNLFSKGSEDIDDTDVVDEDHCYLLKKGKLLTPSMFENNHYLNGCLKTHDHEHSLKADETKSSNFSEPLNSSAHFIKFASIYKKPESYYIYPSPKSSERNTLSREKETTEIFKNTSLDLINSNGSKTFSVYSSNHTEKDVSSDLLNNKSRRYTTLELTDVNPTISCQTHLIDRNQVKKESSNTPRTLSNELHFSSARSMSIVQLLCKERNIDMDDTYTSRYLQYLQETPLQILNTGDKYKTEHFFVHENKNVHFENHRDKRFFEITDNNNSKILNCRYKPIDTDLIKREMENYDLTCMNKTKFHLSETKVDEAKSKDTNLKSRTERTIYNSHKENKVKRKVPPVKTNKSRNYKAKDEKTSKTETENEVKEYGNQIKNKRYLELPNFIDTASSVIKFNVFDKFIKFYESFTPQKEIKDSEPMNQENIYKGIFYVSEDALCTKPSLETDLKKPVETISQQTNTLSPYNLGNGQGSKALSKLQNEVNDLLNSPLLQSSNTVSQTEKSCIKNKSILKTLSRMSDAVSQTRRLNITVDKEVDCNLIQSEENLQQTFKNVDDIFFTKTLKPSSTDVTYQCLNSDEKKDSDVQVMGRPCDGLKATFLFLRKVSDHTVLLRWKIPRDAHEVQGYELQVDGRPVKKILNPSRCMAVLTCLPHCEKLLLTIRTLTKYQTCHNPVTTIVYHAKKVKSGLL